MQLRNYQLQLVDDVRRQIRAGHARILIQLPTGGGKTAIAGHIISQTIAKSNRAMMTVHRSELATQTANTMEVFGVPYGMIQAGELMDLKQPMQIASILTLRNRMERVPAPKILIVDETQHIISRTWKEVADYYGQQGTIIIGLSATPKRLSGEPLGQCFDVMVQGPSIRDLISTGALSEYKYFAPSVGIDTETIHIQRGDFAKNELEVVVNQRKITGDVIEHYQRLIPGRRAIVFCVTVAHAKAVAAQFNGNGISAEFVEGSMPKEARKASIDRFRRGNTLILVNVEIASEGVDIPAVEAVILLRPTMSEALYLQQVGRALRIDTDNPGKVAIILDHCGNVYRHRLPDADREWDLQGGTRKRTAKTPGVGIRYCPQCFGCYSPAPRCPYCGHAKEMTPRLLAEEAGTLREFDAAEAEKAARRSRMEVGMARTIDDLKRIAAERNYNPSWVWIQAKIKGIRRLWRYV